MRGLIDGLPEWFTRFIIAYFIKYLAGLSVLQTSPFFADFFMLENLRVIYLFFVISTDLKIYFYNLCALRTNAFLFNDKRIQDYY